MSPDPELLLLSLGTTWGLRVADADLAVTVREAGASIAIVGTRIGLTDRLRRGYPVNDLVEALAARRALAAALRHRHPRALVLSTTTAALLAGAPELPFAIRIDAPARLNRPGRRNAVLHALERRQFARARLVIGTSPLDAAALPEGSAPAVAISPAIAASQVAPDRPREPLVLAYTPDPKAKGLELVCAAWARTDVPPARLVVTGIPADRARAFLRRRGVSVPAGVELAGMIPQEAFRARLARARVFVSAARWEDFGIAPLEALDRGAALVCAAAGGPFPALGLARRLDARFVSPDRTAEGLARALGAALATDEAALVAYRRRALELLATYRRPALVERMRRDVLPVLLGR
ncbi:MAG: glycosyltransferase [Solirubrobacterales bacterium]|nr:glycosyltransferase [Solirubrobacterales bacterium]MBV9715071.1 glycosyltransferase [Solirubrobacterales bacterium]